MASSQDGGQSFNPYFLVQDTNSSKRNLNLGISQEKAYATYEQVWDQAIMTYSSYTTNGGETFGIPNNISNSTDDTKDSILTVYPLTGKWLVTYLDGVPSVVLNIDCGMC